MPYKIKDLTKTPEGWTGILQSWEGCICSSTNTPFLIKQEERPTVAEIKAAV